MDSCGTKHRSSGKQGRSFVRRFIVPITITEYIIHPVAFTIHILISRFRCPPSVPSTFRINVEYDSTLGARAPKKRRIVQINRSAPTNSVTIVKTFQEFAIEKNLRSIIILPVVRYRPAPTSRGVTKIRKIGVRFSTIVTLRELFRRENKD